MNEQISSMGIFPQISESGELLFLGQSMTPTLKQLDVIHFIPYDNDNIRRGDVIVFHNPDVSGSKIVHRIISIDKEGIRTQGDNNLRGDTGKIHPSDIIGKVVSAQRGKEELVIHGGLHGYLNLQVLKQLHRISGIMMYFLKKSSTWLPSAKILNPFISRFMKKQTVLYQSGDRSEIQVHIHGRVIGRLKSGSDEWEVQSPFHF